MERTLPGVEKNIFVLRKSKQPRRFRLNSLSTANKRKIRQSSSSDLQDDLWPEETNAKDFKTLTILFCRRCSIYALNQVGNSKTTKRRVFWLLILLAGIVGSLVQITNFFKAYHAYPVVVNIYSEEHQQQTFPAVTICNQNIIRKQFGPCLSRGIGYMDCNESVTDLDPEPVLTVDTNCSRLGFSSVTSPYNITFVEARLAAREKLYFELDDESKRQYGHQEDSLIQFCLFRNKICHFKQFLDQNYGNCYTFNAANGETPVQTSLTTEPEEGLILQLDLEADSYIDTKIVGARIQIHDPHQEPDVSSLGFDISPGFQTSIALSRTEIQRLPAPYETMCKDYLPNTTQRSCRMQCKIKSLLEKCGCTTEQTKNARLCDVFKVSDLCCIREITNGIPDCVCPLPCKEFVYKTNSFMAAYPSKAHFSQYPFDYLFDYDDYDKVRENIVKLVIFFETYETTVYEHKPLFDSSEVFSQIGGQIGLWLGVSIVAIFECVEFFVSCFKYIKRSNGSKIGFVSKK